MSLGSIRNFKRLGKGDSVMLDVSLLHKIHYATYDSNTISIHPDYRTEVEGDILREVDWSMLSHGQQETNNSKLILPKRYHDYSKSRRARKLSVKSLEMLLREVLYQYHKLPYIDSGRGRFTQFK